MTKVVERLLKLIKEIGWLDQAQKPITTDFFQFCTNMQFYYSCIQH